MQHRRAMAVVYMLAGASCAMMSGPKVPPQTVCSALLKPNACDKGRSSAYSKYLLQQRL